MDPGFHAAGIWQLLLRTSRGHVNRQFDVRSELAKAPKTVAVSYHYQIANVADWANSPQMKTAHPTRIIVRGAGRAPAVLPQFPRQFLPS